MSAALTHACLTQTAWCLFAVSVKVTCRKWPSNVSKSN